MSPVTFRPAKRESIGLLLMLAGGTGSGKTWSAMRLATGMAGGKRIAYCDTERGRASMYADHFDFDVFELEPPFSPERYGEVVAAAEASGHAVLVIDSMSHEWEGPGGLLDEHERLMDGKESKNLSAWIKPKMSHRRFVNSVLQAKPHVIMCFRAAERVETARGEDGKMKIVPKRSLTGLAGWLPITEKNLPFEASASFMLMADRPGLPHAIKLPDPLKPLIPLDVPLTEATGTALARWAAGGDTAAWEPTIAAEADRLTAEVLTLASNRKTAAAAITKTRAKFEQDPGAFVAWLGAQLERAQKAATQPTT